ncbi:MAG: hypothetical protein VYC84_02245 [Candidatus Neomarinimicrobiota bacterium]|nr:hypothetical protein [Candidatus Neomarinimicrobiota bacterium]
MKKKKMHWIKPSQKLRKQLKKLVYNNFVKIAFFLFLFPLNNLYGQSSLYINEEIKGSFSQGTMEGSINRYFSEDTYYIKSNFHIKILRVFNIKREEGYIISLEDSLVTKINHKKKKYVIYPLSEFLENDEDDGERGPPSESNETNEEDEETVTIGEEIEVLNSFETRKAEITIQEEDEELNMFIWFTEKTLKSPIIESTRKKLENIFNGSIPPSLGFNEMNIPFEEYNINKDAVMVKLQTINKDGTFTYNLLEYSNTKLLPERFKIPEDYKKVKKL